MGALSAAECAEMAGRPTHVRQGLIEVHVGARSSARDHESKWRQLAVASSDVAVDVQLRNMSYANRKGQRLNNGIILL